MTRAAEPNFDTSPGISLFAAVVTHALTQVRDATGVVGDLLPVIMKGLENRSNEDMQIASLVIVSQVSATFTLQEHAFDALVYSISHYVIDITGINGLRALIALYENQVHLDANADGPEASAGSASAANRTRNVITMPSASVEKLLECPNLVDDMAFISRSRSVDKFALSFLVGALPVVSEKGGKCRDTVLRLIGQIDLNEPNVLEFIKRSLCFYIDLGDTNSDTIAQILRYFSHRYPQTTDRAIRVCFECFDDTEKLGDLIENIFFGKVPKQQNEENHSSGQSSKNALPLSLCFSHGADSMRINAATRLAREVQSHLAQFEESTSKSSTGPNVDLVSLDSVVCSIYRYAETAVHHITDENPTVIQQCANVIEKTSPCFFTESPFIHPLKNRAQSADFDLQALVFDSSDLVYSRQLNLSQSLHFALTSLQKWARSSAAHSKDQHELKMGIKTLFQTVCHLAEKRKVSKEWDDFFVALLVSFMSFVPTFLTPLEVLAGFRKLSHPLLQVRSKDKHLKVSYRAFLLLLLCFIYSLVIR